MFRAEGIHYATCRIQVIFYVLAKKPPEQADERSWTGQADLTFGKKALPIW